MALAAKLPSDWMLASAPNAEPRMWVGASPATAAFSAVSVKPIPSPARQKQIASVVIVGPVSARPTKAAAKAAAPKVRTGMLPRRSPSLPAGGADRVDDRDRRHQPGNDAE
jgi:hypothetical protein